MCMRAMPRDAGERSLIHPRMDIATHARRRLARYRESEQGTREDGTEAPAATAATAAGRRLVAEMPKEVPHEVRHLLAGADWSAPNCKARAAKTLEQIIQVRPACWSPTNPGARVSAPTDSCGQSLQCKGRLLTFVNPMLVAWGVLSPSLQLVDTFPVDDLTNEAVSDTIDKIRGKFKSAVSQLGMVRGDVTKQGGLAF